MPKFKIFVPSPERPCVTLINYVHNDGIGDFKHLMEFSKYFNEILAPKGIDIVCIIINAHTKNDPQSNYIEETLDTLPGSHKILIFDSTDGHKELYEIISSNSSLKAQLRKMLAIIDISLTNSYKLVIQKFSPMNIASISITQIDLHVILDKPAIPLKKAVSSLYKPDQLYIMGLGNDKAGLKLTRGRLNTPEKAHLALQQISDNRIIKLLLNLETIDQLSQETVDEFLKNYYFIPGYLQNPETFLGFISMFASNNVLREEGKDLIFFFNNFRNIFKRNRLDEDTGILSSRFGDLLINPVFSWSKAFAASDIQSIKIYNYTSRESTEEVIKLNGTGRKITILSGIQLHDTDYNLLYDIPQHFAAVSGDNTLENAVNHGLLFLMEYRYQFHTVRQIAQIVEEMQLEFGFNEAEVHEFGIFFGEAHHYITYSNEKAKRAHDALQSIDLPRLALNMKKVCEYLIEHKNFLDQLPNILDNILPTDYVVTPSALAFAD